MKEKNTSKKHQPKYLTLKERNVSPLKVYIIFSVSCLAALFCCLLLSRGELISRYFYRDTLDTGMDFFHSIEYTRGRQPYETFGTLYPPLANLFFYVIYLMIPQWITQYWANDFSTSIAMRDTSLDLRTDQACLMAYLVFVMVCTILLFSMIDYALKDEEQRHAKWAAACMILSFGCLNAIERGNIIIFCTALSLVFILFYRSRFFILKEVALFSLAISAGLKIYPALLGLLLIKEKDWKAAIRCVIYGICSAVLPLFAFEGLSALNIWMGKMTSFNTTPQINWIGTGFERIMNNGVRLISEIFSVTLPSVSFKSLSVFVCILLLLSSLFMEKRWKSCIAATLPMLLLQSQGNYSLCMILVPLVMFFQEEKHIAKYNIVPFTAMMLLTANLPLFYTYGVSDPRNTVTHFALLTMVIWCIFEAGHDLIAHFYFKKNGK